MRTLRLPAAGAALALAAGLLLPTLALADGLDSLQAFLRDAHSGSAHFEQTVTAPPRQEGPGRQTQSSGEFQFQRPGRFRFEYQQPYQQEIVADGSTLWLYDADLEQVTRRSQQQALGQTPAALIASAASLQELERDFTLEAEPERDGLQWVLARPRIEDGQLQSVRMGFDGEQLARLEILDSFGQRSLLEFSQVRINVTLPVGIFEFQPPDGVDVLQQ